MGPCVGWHLHGTCLFRASERDTKRGQNPKPQREGAPPANPHLSSDVLSLLLRAVSEESRWVRPTVRARGFHRWAARGLMGDTADLCLFPSLLTVHTTPTIQ